MDSGNINWKYCSIQLVSFLSINENIKNSLNLLLNVTRFQLKLWKSYHVMYRIFIKKHLIKILFLVCYVHAESYIVKSQIGKKKHEYTVCTHILCMCIYIYIMCRGAVHLEKFHCFSSSICLKKDNVKLFVHRIRWRPRDRETERLKENRYGVKKFKEWLFS